MIIDLILIALLSCAAWYINKLRKRLGLSYVDKADIAKLIARIKDLESQNKMLEEGGKMLELDLIALVDGDEHVRFKYNGYMGVAIRKAHMSNSQREIGTAECMAAEHDFKHFVPDANFDPDDAEIILINGNHGNAISWNRDGILYKACLHSGTFIVSGECLGAGKTVSFTRPQKMRFAVEEIAAAFAARAERAEQAVADVKIGRSGEHDVNGKQSEK